MTDPLDFLSRPRPEDEPSELALDRYAAGELDPESRRRVESWLERSPSHRARLDERRAFPAALRGPPSERLFSRIEAELEPRPSRLATFLRALISPRGLGGLALVAAVLVVSVRPWQADEIRTKGGLGFLVFKKVAAGSEVVVSGAPVIAGDVLRFEVDLPEARFVLVIHQDRQGALSAAWPLFASSSRSLPAGRQTLEGAVELDGAAGPEWLHATSCSQEHPLAAFTSETPGRLVAPDDCATSTLLLDKATP